jgi:hypothetical protein
MWVWTGISCGRWCTIFAQVHSAAAKQQLNEVVKAMSNCRPEASAMLADADDDILAYMQFLVSVVGLESPPIVG